MFPASASTEHAAPSLSLVATSGTSLSLTVPQGGNKPIHLTFRREGVFPTGAFLEIILIFTLTFIMGGIVRARLSPS
jgi:hypothetical protein